MSENKKQVFNERLKALHEKYTTQLPGKYHEIMESWQALKSNPDNEEAFETFYRMIHTLKGTAATFGFTTQADFCFAIQQTLLKVKNESLSFADGDYSDIESCLADLKANIDAPAENIGQA